MKTRILSVIMALALAISIFVVSTGSVSAAGKPDLSIKNVSGGQRITCSSTGVQRYYLYFGVYNYDTRKAEWRVYREVKGTNYIVNHNSLHHYRRKTFYSSKIEVGVCACANQEQKQLVLLDFIHQ